METENKRVICEFLCQALQATRAAQDLISLTYIPQPRLRLFYLFRTLPASERYFGNPIPNRLSAMGFPHS